MAVTRLLRRRCRLWALLAVAASLSATQVHARTLKATVTVAWQPAKLVRGSPVLFQVSDARAQAVSGQWMGHKLSFFRSENGTTWYALAGIPVETKPGSYDLSLSETLKGRTAPEVKKIKVGDASYPRIAAHVAKKFTEPNADQLKQISADKSVKENVLATESEQRLWKGRFEAPVSVPVSDIFGTERVFNGQVQSRHLGLDFAAPAGTPVHAINRGTVLLAQQLYFEGGFVVIDHGQGLLSLYLHLSDFQVKPGDEVAAGEAIGLSGSSGRATGPHLHLAVRWQGVYLDPAVLLRLQTP
ncbi:MAG TPA: M23 family metallopeptidase [Terriglobales bacterium]|jgi:murein DD-endopeptidase MepM/ murein hydrolase activator NlpD